jgi:hypothetical protein
MFCKLKLYWPRYSLHFDTIMTGEKWGRGRKLNLNRGVENRRKPVVCDTEYHEELVVL